MDSGQGQGYAPVCQTTTLTAAAPGGNPEYEEEERKKLNKMLKEKEEQEKKAEEYKEQKERMDASRELDKKIKVSQERRLRSSFGTLMPGACKKAAKSLKAENRSEKETVMLPKEVADLCDFNRITGEKKCAPFEHYKPLIVEDAEENGYRKVRFVGEAQTAGYMSSEQIEQCIDSNFMQLRNYAPR